MKSKIIAFLASLLALGAVGVFAASPASALSVVNTDCGSGYNSSPVINTALYYPTGNQERLGNFKMYWNSTSRRACIFFERAYAVQNAGAAYTDVELSHPVTGGYTSLGNDGGTYTYYAGPVYSPTGIPSGYRFGYYGGTTDNATGQGYFINKLSSVMWTAP